MNIDPHMRAVVSVAAAAREVADSAYALVAEIGEESTTRDRIRAWRSVRLRALTGLDRCVLAELLAGATWAEVADGYGLSVEEMRARFEPTLNRWRAGASVPGASAEFATGLPGDTDVEGTAAALDSWAERHAEPWMSCPPRPVTRAVSV